MLTHPVCATAHRLRAVLGRPAEGRCDAPGSTPSMAPGVCRNCTGMSRSPGWWATTRPPAWSPPCAGSWTRCAFPAHRHACGPVADALTYADQTTGPDGHQMDVADRLAEMLRRHGPDSPNA
jgi:hypothetical protein